MSAIAADCKNPAIEAEVDRHNLPPSVKTQADEIARAAEIPDTPEVGCMAEKRRLNLLKVVLQENPNSNLVDCWSISKGATDTHLPVAPSKRHRPFAPSRIDNANCGASYALCGEVTPCGEVTRSDALSLMRRWAYA